MVSHNEGEFISADNTPLVYQAWIPEEPKFVIIYLHGALGHSGEAKFLAEYMTEQGGALYAMDQRGWGRSSDRKAGHIDNRQQVLDDVSTFLTYVRSIHPNLPYVLMGHSMGGMISLRYLIDHQDEFVCAAISSPWIGTRVPVPAYAKILGPILSKIWPTFTEDAEVKIDELTHDNAVITRYHNEIEEGLRRTHVTSRWFHEMQKMQNEVKAGAEHIRIPIIVMQAGQDLIVAEGLSKLVYNAISSEKKKWQYYERSYHELWNETDRASHFKEVFEFIDHHIKTV